MTNIHFLTIFLAFKGIQKILLLIVLGINLSPSIYCDYGAVKLRVYSRPKAYWESVQILLIRCPAKCMIIEVSQFQRSKMCAHHACRGSFRGFLQTPLKLDFTQTKELASYSVSHYTSDSDPAQYL